MTIKPLNVFCLTILFTFPYIYSSIFVNYAHTHSLLNSFREALHLVTKKSLFYNRPNKHLSVFVLSKLVYNQGHYFTHLSSTHLVDICHGIICLLTECRFVCSPSCALSCHPNGGFTNSIIIILLNFESCWFDWSLMESCHGWTVSTEVLSSDIQVAVIRSVGWK